MKKLYHFTAWQYMPFIIKEGISNGDVPVTRSHFIRFPWFTGNPDPNDQTYNRGSWKRAVRLTVEFDGADPLLVRWREYAQMLRIRQDLFEVLNRGHYGNRYWYVYRGVVEFDRVTEVHLMNPHRTLSTAEAKDLFRSVPGTRGFRLPRVEITEAEAIALTQEDHNLGNDPEISKRITFGRPLESDAEIRRLKARLSTAGGKVSTMELVQRAR